jgi:hypothetical protein
MRGASAQLEAQFDRAGEKPSEAPLKTISPCIEVGEVGTRAASLPVRSMAAVQSLAKWASRSVSWYAAP